MTYGFTVAMATLPPQGAPGTVTAHLALEPNRRQDVAVPIELWTISTLISVLEAQGATIAWARSYDGDGDRMLFFEPGVTPVGSVQDFDLVRQEAGGPEIRGFRLNCTQVGTVTWDYDVVL